MIGYTAVHCNILESNKAIFLIEIEYFVSICLAVKKDKAAADEIVNTALAMELSQSLKLFLFPAVLVFEGKCGVSRFSC